MTTAALPALLLQHGPWMVLGVTVAARIGLPLPAAPLLLAAGALAAAGHFSLPALLLLVTLSVFANLVGDGLWFWAGRRHGERVFRLLCRGRPAERCIQRSQATMRRWGDGALLAAKFLPVVSTVAPPLAGAMGMSLMRFVVVEIASALIWTLACMGLGAVFAKEVDALLHWLSGLDLTGTGSLLLCLALLGAFAWLFKQRRPVALPLEPSVKP